MSGPGRRAAIGVTIAAALLAAGYACSGFLADRLWEASLSNAAAVAGLRRALLALALEAALAIFTAGWLALHWGLALRIALPIRAGAGDDPTRVWPRTVPRWTVPLAAILLGLLLGSGGSRLLEPLQLYLDGVPMGIRDPLLDEDLGTFLGGFPLWSALQTRAVVLCLLAGGGAALLYLVGGRIDRIGRRIRVSPTARGHLAILVALLALSLAWGTSLEPLRLASGDHGPVRHAEFFLRAVMGYLQTGLGAAAAVVSLLCWIRIRGSVALLFWAMFALAWIGGELLPLHPQLARSDPVWRSDARRLDSVAFRLVHLDGPPGHPRPSAGALTVSLWDDSVALRAGLGAPSHREWLPAPAPAGSVPVWLGAGLRGSLPAILALADDRVSPSGAPLFWSPGAAAPTPGPQGFWLSEPGSLRVHPDAPRLLLIQNAPGPGVRLSSLPRRLVLAWAWQYLPALSQTGSSRLEARLDPTIRLRALAPFAHWSAPHLRRSGSRFVWQSDGLLVADGVPSSERIAWGSEAASLVISAFMGVVDAESGEVRIFQRDSADALASAWARIARPLIESPDRISGELRDGEAYPPELAEAQARVLAGPAWRAGSFDAVRRITATESPGGNRRVMPLIRPGTQLVGALLLLERLPSGDSLRLIPLDSLPPLESPAALGQRWERFPFQQMLRDSVLAAGAAFRSGLVRYEISAEGPVAYQPGWAEGPAARPRLVLVNVALGSRLGTGRSFEEAWRNLRGEMSPAPVGPESLAILDEVRRWWQRADSAWRRGDLLTLGQALAQLRELLERQP